MTHGLADWGTAHDAAAAGYFCALQRLAISPVSRNSRTKCCEGVIICTWQCCGGVIICKWQCFGVAYAHGRLVGCLGIGHKLPKTDDVQCKLPTPHCWPSDSDGGSASVALETCNCAQPMAVHAAQSLF